MPTPPQTITLTPASAPAAPGTITLSAASAPAAPSTITRSAASAPGGPRVVPRAPAGNVYATLTTAQSGTNNDIKFTSLLPGTEGNSIRIILANSSSVFVEVSGYDIECELFTGSSTSAEVIAAINAHAVASLMVFAENAPGNDGSGVILPASAANLSGGTTGNPSAPSTITLTAASQPAAPGVITPS